MDNTITVWSSLMYYFRYALVKVSADMLDEVCSLAKHLKVSVELKLPVIYRDTVEGESAYYRSSTKVEEYHLVVVSETLPELGFNGFVKMQVEEFHHPGQVPEITRKLTWIKDEIIEHTNNGIAIDPRPANCRNRLRDNGKTYPRSGCQSCNNGGLMGCPYEKK
jgi:hypothetical protein